MKGNLLKGLSSIMTGSYSRMPSIFDNRQVHLTDKSLYDFLDLMEDQIFELRIESIFRKG